MQQKNIFNHLKKMLFLLFWMIAFTTITYAQNGTSIYWTQQVGCIEYDSEGTSEDPKRLRLLEDIEDGPCVRFCEYTSVTYTIFGDDITDVSWTVTGGTITNTYGPVNESASIDWDAAGNGFIGIIISYSDGSEQNITICVEKIVSPKAEFDIYGINPEPVFCIDSDVYFDNLSITNGGTDLFAYFWDFGDGTYSTAYEPVHNYNQAGNYNVKLVVYNLCNCYSSYSLEVKIEDKPDVEIYCPAIVCEGDIANYTTSANCPGNWEVTGGTIVANNGISIDVRWDQVGPDGFGTVNYRSECACPFWTSIRVPVILRRGQITGPSEICVGDQGVFSLPQWATTDFLWNLNSLSNPGSATSLVYTSQRNKIVVDALEPGDYVLQCKYYNTLVGCEGSASFSFTIGEGTSVIGEQEVCENIEYTYTNSENAVVDWTLISNNTVVATFTGVSFQHTFTDSGSYTLSVVNGNNSCDSEPFTIDVYDTPQPPSGTLDGEIYICPGNPYEYTLANNNPNVLYEWSVTNGTIFGSSTGETVTVEFGPAGPYALSVTQKFITTPGCESEARVFDIYPLQPDVVVTNDENKTIFCPSSVTTYTASFLNFTPDYIEWLVLDNFGNVIDGINSPTVTVSWNEISNSNAGVLRLRVKACGEDYYIDTNVELYELPELDLDVPTAVCFGSQINAELIITSPQPVTSGSVLWDFGNGSTQTTPVSSSGLYTLNNPYTNTTGSNIDFTITATLVSPNGCSHEPYSTDVILVYPQTTISISPGYDYGICPDNYDGSIIISANAVSGLNLTLTYQWYRNGGPIQYANSSTYQIPVGSPLGVYYVQVEDSNGCIVNSQNISVSDNCEPGDPCSIPSDANINLSAGWTSCNTISASLSFNGTASVSWVGSPLISLVSGNTGGAQFYTDVPGTHLITAFITFQTPQGPCMTQRQVEVITNYDPDFNYTVTCNGAGTGYDVTLFNNSTIFDIGSGNPVTYTFSSPAMTTQVGEEVTVSNLTPGSYNFTLQLTSPGRPSCSITKTIVLDPLPNASIGSIDSIYCAESPITLTINNYNPNNTYQWFFNGTSYIASGPVTEIQIANAFTNFQVMLEESSPLSCSSISYSGFTDIIKNEYLNALLTSANTPACQGQNPSPSITFSPGLGNPMPTSFEWMKGDQVVASSMSNVFTPTATGTYWVTAYDANGCRFASNSGASVIILSQPQVRVSGPTTVCNEGEESIHGSGPSSGVEYRWLINSAPALGAYGTWSSATPLDIPIDTATPGTYTFTLEVRLIGSSACSNTDNITVTVYPAVVEPVLSYQVITCEPYLVEVTASGGQGSYNWTNGTSGTTTYSSTGGAIGVYYTDANGCQTKTTLTIPHPLEASLWMIPTGCYSLCLTADPAWYVLAPLITVGHYEWMVNNQVVLSGTNSPVSNIEVTQAGDYQLILEQDGCIKESNTFSVSPSFEECEYDDCKLRIVIRNVIYSREGVYLVSGYIVNGSSAPMTVSLSSFNSYGVYIPSSVTIPAGGTYNFGPLQFIPDSSFNGGTDILIVQGEDCLQAAEITFPKGGSSQARSAVQDDDTKLIMTPNPAESFTIVEYDLGNMYSSADKLIIYNLLGIPVNEIKLNALSGKIEVSTEILSSGSYIVSIEADGQRALQRVLVIK